MATVGALLVQSLHGEGRARSSAANAPALSGLRRVIIIAPGTDSNTPSTTQQ